MAALKEWARSGQIHHALSFSVKATARRFSDGVGRSGCREQSLHHGKAPQLRHPHPARAAEVPAPGFHSSTSFCCEGKEKKKKKGLAICQIALLPFPSDSRRRPLERRCKVLFVHVTQGFNLVFYKLNPKKPTPMKIFCFNYSQLEVLPAFLMISYLSCVLHLNLVTSILPARCL